MSSTSTADVSNSVFAVFDYTVVIAAFAANCVVLAAISRISFNLRGYRRFLISLTCSDLFVCCVNACALVYQILKNSSQEPIINHPYFNCGANALRTLQLAGFFTNLLNLCGMSLDHFIGIVYPLKYRYWMNKSVARLAVVAIWVLSFALASLDIPINVVLYHNWKASEKQETKSSDVFSFGMEPFYSYSEYYGYGYENEKFPLPDHLPSTTMENYVSSVTSPVNPPVFKSSFASGSSSPALVINGGDEETTEEYEDSTKQDPTILLNKIFAELRAEEETERLKETPDIFCTFPHETKMWFDFSTMVLAILCTITLSVSYSIVAKKVSDSIDFSGRKTTRKILYTTAMLLGAFVICWIPFISFELVMLIRLKLSHQTHKSASDEQHEATFVRGLFLQHVFNSLLRIYPLLDPIIYAFRIPACRHKIIQMVISCCPEFCTRSCRNIKMTNSRSLTVHSSIGQGQSAPKVSTKLRVTQGGTPELKVNDLEVDTLHVTDNSNRKPSIQPNSCPPDAESQPLVVGKGVVIFDFNEEVPDVATRDSEPLHLVYHMNTGNELPLQLLTWRDSDASHDNQEVAF